ncbi:hypothetical protein KUCAC02_001149, partial [Chaenocephalus aceratus]
VAIVASTTAIGHDNICPDCSMVSAADVGEGAHSVLHGGQCPLSLHQQRRLHSSALMFAPGVMAPFHGPFPPHTCSQRVVRADFCDEAQSSYPQGAHYTSDRAEWHDAELSVQEKPAVSTLCMIDEERRDQVFPLFRTHFC